MKISSLLFFRLSVKPSPLRPKPHKLFVGGFIVFLLQVYISNEGDLTIVLFFNTPVLPTSPVCGCTFCSFSFVVSPNPEADDSPSVTWSEDPRWLHTVSQCLPHSPYLVTCCFIISHHHKKCGYGTMRSFERDHIHITCIIAYCYNCSILLISCCAKFIS